MAEVRFPIAARNAQAAAYRDLIDGEGPAGTLAIYEGPMPESGDDAPAGEPLATLTFAYPSAPDPVDGVLEFAPLAEDPAAAVSGEAAWARIADAAGNPVIDLDVSDRDGDGAIRINTTSIVADGPVRIGALTLTMPERAP